MQAVIIILLILAILLVIFTLQNSMEITINVFFWEISNAPLVLVLICCIVIGYLLAVIYFSPRIWKLKRDNKRMTKQNNKLTEENESHNIKSKEESHPEGIELDDDKEMKKDSFFGE